MLILGMPPREEMGLQAVKHIQGTTAINHEFTAACCCHYCSLHKSKVLFVLRFPPKDLPVLS